MRYSFRCQSQQSEKLRKSQDGPRTIWSMQRANTLRLWGIHATMFHQTGLSDFKMSGG